MAQSDLPEAQVQVTSALRAGTGGAGTDGVAVCRGPVRRCVEVSSGLSMLAG